ncbi:MAG: beta-ketoacyl synthase N-terminal-like domain-containing protein [Nostoc sp. DedQUE08]|uniref:type I polyketide synthase n=1 Tax=Nostoc sp. DedQUE08 TaxID=3075393 RepID=UPI002AD43EDF|nr:beta-ketoacyl synthase N-terminal-like domain-containing protein [Nostoc sp. DedQUE08]MDZ8064886.1 beta-ketoacyl synthase N-terminal-like domain-containing protein [Nostoc sp. DedQUE08]
MNQEPIAIVGIGCRFPGGVQSPASFWNLLQNGRDAITEIPGDRWNVNKFYHPDPVEPGKMYSRWGGFLDQIDQFDAKFFGISGAEAARIDPQQRLLLETTWEALEDAGLVPEHLAGSDTGVFIGVLNRDYNYIQLGERDRDAINAHTIVSSNLNLVPNRISYCFDFTGPSLPIDAGCASSLVAVHFACSSLWNGECSLALAGGVNVIFKPEVSIAMSKAFLLSADGRCKSFDAAADGFVRAEGVGVVVLKPLSHALADGDAIYATIRSSAVSQNGRGSSFTAPEALAQQAVMQKAYQRAGILPQQVQYVETQGSSSSMGDEIEAKAIGAVIGSDRALGNECAIGSVKTNIGHMEAAAGIGGLIKAALAVSHRQIPANLHFQTPNPKIPWQELRLRVAQSLEPLINKDNQPPIVSVNGFGLGGMNVHVILQGVEIGKPRSLPIDAAIANQPQLFLMSARSPEALKAFAKAYIEFFTAQDNPTISLADICYTTSLRRSHHSYRLAMVVDSKKQLVEHLMAFLAQESRPSMFSGYVEQQGEQRGRGAEGQGRSPQFKILNFATERAQILNSLAERYTLEDSIDWNALYPHGSSFVRLPFYPWQRQRYWHESEASRQDRLGESNTAQASSVVDSKIAEQIDIIKQWSVAINSQRTDLLSTYIQAQIVQALECEPVQVDVQKPLNSMGIDSLMAVSLRNHIVTNLKIELPIEQFIASPSIAELAQACHEQLILKNLIPTIQIANFVEEIEELTL